MGQKVNPIGFRLGVRRNWSARWYANKKDYSQFMEEDNMIRGFLEKKLRYASVPRIVIERASTRTRVTIWTARPGIVIGRKGQELDSLKDSLNKTVGKDIRLEIQEIKKPDLVASLVAENVALQLERRIAFRRAMKKAVQTTMSMGAEGIRIQCAGQHFLQLEMQRGRVSLFPESLSECLCQQFCLASLSRNQVPGPFVQ